MSNEDTQATGGGDQNDDNNMPIQERGETERAKGPMSPPSDGEDEEKRAKGPMSPQD